MQVTGEQHVYRKGRIEAADSLFAKARSLCISENGTFDLSIDDSDAEVKAKGKPFADLDFIT